jgi:micrococcal nuclease
MRRRRRWPVWLPLILLVVVGANALRPVATAAEVRVVAVQDGDTVTLLMPDLTELRVRLHGIDAPESRQPFGARSKQSLSDLVYGRNVRLDARDVDRYGRTIGVLFIDGRNANVEQVRRGMAWWYRQYAPDDRELERAEAEAKRARRGLWSEPRPVAPWDWRRGNR